MPRAVWETTSVTQRDLFRHATGRSCWREAFRTRSCGNALSLLHARHAECYVPLISSKCVYLLICFFVERVQVPSTLLTKENEKLFQSKISSSYVRDLFVENNEINQAYMSNLVMSQFGEVLCFDATFRDAKRIYVQGQKVRMIYVLGFQALTLQQDMRCMILVRSLAQTTALSTI